MLWTHLGPGRVGGIVKIYAVSAQAQNRETPISIEEPDMQRAAGDLARGAPWSAAVHLVRRSLLQALVGSLRVVPAPPPPPLPLDWNAHEPEGRGGSGRVRPGTMTRSRS